MRPETDVNEMSSRVAWAVAAFVQQLHGENLDSAFIVGLAYEFLPIAQMWVEEEAGWCEERAELRDGTEPKEQPHGGA